MARHKNSNWVLNPEVKSWDEVHAALLMDIRDELQQLNRTLGCFRLARMSDDIHRIDQRLAKNPACKLRTKSK